MQGVELLHLLFVLPFERGMRDVNLVPLVQGCLAFVAHNAELLRSLIIVMFESRVSICVFLPFLERRSVFVLESTELPCLRLVMVLDGC